jgi:putative peptide zinc metalloprotease protein
MQQASLLTGLPPISSYDASRWVVQCPSGHQLLVNNAGADLLLLLAETATLQQGLLHFTARFGGALTVAEFEDLVQQQFGGYRLLAQDARPERPQVASPFGMRLELVSAKWAGRLAEPLTRCYQPAIFWPLLGTLSVGMVAVQQLAPRLPLGELDSVWIAGIFYLSVPVHELGHIAACRAAGLTHGGMGFGMYYFFPLLYADITAIWQASRQQRVIANLGGILSQLLYAGIVAGAGLVLNEPAGVLAGVAVAISAAWQLNPFVRHDGYWLLSDLTNTPNLLTKAHHARQQFLSWASVSELLRGRWPASLHGRRAWLVAYGVFNPLLLVGFLTYALSTSGHAILHFPGLAHTLLTKLFSGSLTAADFSSQVLTVLAFYSWLLRWGGLRLLSRRRQLVKAT